MKLCIGVLIALLYLLPAKAQRTAPSPYSTGFIRYGYVKVDSAFIPATRDTNWRPQFIGTTVLWQRPGIDTVEWWYLNKWVIKNKSVSTSGGTFSETDPTISNIIKSIPITTDVTTNKYYFWNNGTIGRKQILYSELSGVPTLSAVATTGSYSSLIDKPAYAMVAVTGSYTDLINKPTYSTVTTTGSYTDLINKPTLSTVATTGSYNDLLNKPTILAKNVHDSIDAYLAVIPPATTSNQVYYNTTTGKLSYGPLASGGTVTAGVASFNSRTGTVIPIASDYSAFFSAVNHTHTIADVTSLQASLDLKKNTIDSGWAKGPTAYTTMGALKKVADSLGAILATKGSGTGTGTVVNVSVVTANGLSGTVANSTTTPSITLGTNVNGLVKGNGTAFSAATVRTDYAEPTTALATGILKNTTTTGAHSIATPGVDYVIPSGNITGTASGITGTITETQVTNLPSDLAAKAPVSTTVTLTGNQSVTNKTLTNPAFTAQTLTDASTTAWNMTNGSVATWTIAGNNTLSITNPIINTYEQLAVIQDVSGNRTVTWPASFKWEGGVVPVLSTTAGAVDLITCFYNGTSHFCTYGKDYK